MSKGQAGRRGSEQQQLEQAAMADGGGDSRGSP